ncbi:MAG TPA: NADH-quinone oxidoreductase subunit L, partial [Solirubrobacteraceae bacterium]
MATTTYGWLVLLFPLLGTLSIGFGYRVLPGRWAGVIGTGAIALAFVAALGALISLESHSTSHQELASTLWNYANTVGVNAKVSILVDPLSVFMILIVSGISSMIHLYSISYLEEDRGFARYFAYLNFFVFAMLLLVLAGNFLLLIVGWALVGAASYLLISFWYRRTTATKAGIKAFVINVLGDAGLVLGTYFIFKHTHTLDFLGTFAAAPHVFHSGEADIVAGCLLLLVGAIAKSAQIPLHTWLPDAMEGPTPVSALVHAATMVTAGVYLIVRTHPLFENAYVIQDLAAGLGAATLVMAGLIALVQVDIKRVIAYSTMSQIGYMFLGAGVGAYANGMFHLLTHAFFKALLFMAAGLVIHAVANEQDIRKLRGVGALMPWTRWAFLAGALALVGVPPFSGFFSKDSIIAAALHDHWYGVILAAAGLGGAFLTGLYTFRLYFIVFPGEPSAFVREHHHAHHGKEGPLTMLVPVGVLTVLAVIGGWLQFSPIWHPLTTWLEPVARTLPVAEPSNTQEAVASILAVALGLAGIGVAWAMYGRGELAVPRLPAAQRMLEHKFYFDEAYDALFFKPAALLATHLPSDFEEPVVLATGTDLGQGTLDVGEGASRLQTGLLRTYVLFLGTGLA